jgi:hypothetical protein
VREMDRERHKKGERKRKSVHNMYTELVYEKSGKINEFYEKKISSSFFQWRCMTHTQYPLSYRYYYYLSKYIFILAQAANSQRIYIKN